MVADIYEEVVLPGIKANRIFADEPARFGIEVPRPRKLQDGFGVEVSASEAERIHERAAGRSLISERVVRVGLCYRSRRVAERSDGAKSVLFVVTRRTAPQHRQRLVRREGWSVAGNDCARGI